MTSQINQFIFCDNNTLNPNIKFVNNKFSHFGMYLNTSSSTKLLMSNNEINNTNISLGSNVPKDAIVNNYIGGTFKPNGL